MSKTGSGPKTRKLWSEQEDNILRSEAAEQANRGKVQDWLSIAAKLPGRDNKDCRKRWIKLDGPVNKGPWSEEEDQRLREAVWQHSTVWTEVARAVGTRHADQCTKRWLHFLSPDLNHSEWTEQEDEHLLVAVDNSGHNWRKIVDEVLKGRSATDAKNRYTILQQRSKRNSNSRLHGAAAAARPSRRKNSSPLPCKGSSSAMDKEAQNNSAQIKPLENSMGVMKQVSHDNALRGETRCLNDPFDPMFMQMASSGFEYPTEPISMQQPQQQQQEGYAVMPALDWQSAQMPPITQNHHPFQQSINEMPRFTPSFFTNDPLGGQSLPNSLVDSYMDMACTEAETSALLPSPPASVIPTEAFGGTPKAPATSKPQTKDDEEDEEEDDEEDEDDDDEAEEEMEADGGQPIEAADVQSFRQPVRSDKQGSPDAWIKERSSSSSSNNRKSTMVLKNMKPDLVGQVLKLLFSSESVVDVKIFSQD